MYKMKNTKIVQEFLNELDELDAQIGEKYVFNFSVLQPYKVGTRVNEVIQVLQRNGFEICNIQYNVNDKGMKGTTYVNILVKVIK